MHRASKRWSYRHIRTKQERTAYESKYTRLSRAARSGRQLPCERIERQRHYDKHAERRKKNRHQNSQGYHWHRIVFSGPAWCWFPHWHVYHVWANVIDHLRAMGYHHRTFQENGVEVVEWFGRSIGNFG